MGVGNKLGDRLGDGMGDGTICQVGDERGKSRVTELGEWGHNAWTSQYSACVAGYLMIITVKKDIKLLSTVHKDMYLDIFKALIVKRIASKKRDITTTTPSIRNLEDYMMRQWDTPQHQPKREPEDVPVPWDTQPEPPYMDPTIENAITSINAPQQAGESNNNYCKCCTAATWYNHVMFDKTPSPVTFYQPDNMEDMESTRPVAPRTSEASGLTIQVP